MQQIEITAVKQLADLVGEMLQTLRVAECAVEQFCNGQDPENQCWVTLSEIRAAIAKATGAS